MTPLLAGTLYRLRQALRALAAFCRRLLPEGRLYRRLLAVVTVVVVGVGAYVVYASVIRHDPSCGAGVEERGPKKECTGVTDGTVVFAPPLKQVSERIKAENDAVAGKTPVTIALMVPMISSNPAEQRELVEQVQGAYLAQYRANHRSNNQRPPVRLLLANPGHNYEFWRPVADRLVAAAASETENLRAVTGINISLDATSAALSYLTNTKGIPVVPGPLTGNDFANTAERPHAYRGLARVVPTNTDQAAALESYSTGAKKDETMVVEDIREGDNYLATLRQAFERLARGAKNAPETFRSPQDFNDEGNLSNDFHQMVPDICASDATTVYFAGRPVQLRQFLVELGKRTCDKHYTVVSGSHAATLTVDAEFADEWSSLTRGAGITVRYAGLAHPDAWSEGSPGTTREAREAFKEFSDLAAEFAPGSSHPIGPVSLTDSRTMVTYDSVITAVAGIRNTTVGAIRMPTLAEVAGGWLRLHGTHTVHGASGSICLDRYGNPYNKAIPIVHLDPVAKKAVFDRLAWPQGRPSPANCTAPNKPGGN
ncbi:type 1 periplasmic-binding domain-containing protein [Streptomyces varsoviensis]|uniref:Leucine-binding protein domain-containing protein n=1 Tax=Streptomyces varsoviensis TaxID=67373 RepID=A0ABR5JEP8_9ACTN|nr:hypothetical protein [Streptomyces varsoviensis]KOG91824.1 hypothetical protein ADK38_01030 [Streptomyces varsoviensis]